jgi:hypothetical protein
MITFSKREPVVIPCVACGAKPNSDVPDGAGTLPLCWACAHAHVDHELALSRCAVHACDCAAANIYPAKVIAAAV